MKVAVAQLNPKVADFPGNLSKALSALEQVRSESPDLVIFTELFLVGYPPLDFLERDWFVEKQQKCLEEICRFSKDLPETGIVIGAAWPNHRPTGRGIYNAAVLIHRGEIVFTQAKTLLPTYDVFDEDRYFDPAEEVKVFPFKGEVLGLSVCEDVWSDTESWNKRCLYQVDPIKILAAQGATLLVNISASPFHAGKDALRFHLIRNQAIKNRLPIVFANQVGGNDELIFDGRSMCLDARGRPLSLFPAFTEQIGIVDLNQKEGLVQFAPQDETESIYQALVMGIRDYMHKSGFSSAMVGLSGGIDSAVTFCLAVAALGRENVLGITMPSMYSSTGSVEDSRRLAANLAAELKIIPIKGVYDAYLNSLSEHFAGREPDVAEENIQARIRGNILMAFSNKFGHLLLSTGNKSELSMGYCTLYGDMSGGLAVISDVPKMQVYALARYINREKEIIPQATVDKAPSAELRPDQKDEDSLPPYALLDQVLHLFIEEGLSSQEIIDRGFEPDMARWVVRMVSRNEYKRRQAAPGLKVTSKAFGIGRRMPIVASHEP